MPRLLVKGEVFRDGVKIADLVKHRAVGHSTNLALGTWFGRLPRLVSFGGRQWWAVPLMERDQFLLSRRRGDACKGRFERIVGSEELLA
jgi:hypothetical protein